MHVSRARGHDQNTKKLTEGDFYGSFLPVVFPREDDFVEGTNLVTHTGGEKWKKSFKTHTQSSIWFEGGHQILVASMAPESTHTTEKTL